MTGVKVTFGGDDGIGNEHTFEGGWCRRCGALDYGDGGKPKEPRYWTVGDAAGRISPGLDPPATLPISSRTSGGHVTVRSIMDALRRKAQRST